MTNHIHDYFKSVCEAYRLGNIETSYNAPIIALFSPFGCNARDLSGERSRQAGENIDIKIWHGDVEITETEPFASVEVKKIAPFDERAKNQIRKEAKLYGYAILTNNLSWQFWRANDDTPYDGVQLISLKDGKLILNEENIESFISAMQHFLLQDPTQIRSSNKLAEYMAIHAKTIRSVITRILKENAEGLPLLDDRQKRIPLFPELHGLFTRIKTDLRPFLKTKSFADMYAQTIVYGLFIARYNDAAAKTFNRYEAIGKLQEESALLNRFFEHITNTGTKHPTLDDAIGKLCALYQQCDISALLDCNKRGDTIVHFYEDFLTYYDPALRKSLGVFYTPRQVVRYLVSMVDKLLVEDFGIKGGLSNNEQIQIKVPSERHEYQKKKGAKKEWLDTKEVSAHRVAILDPACGTGTFHAEIIKYIKDTYFSGVRAAFYDEYMRNENGLLSRMIGFEIMMTSYAVAHLNVRRTIEETLGHIPDTQLPTKIFLTNTLAPPTSTLERLEQMSLYDFSAAITDEAYNADTWKTRRPIKVIIGNPPYLAASTNPFDISAYKFETDGKTKLNEKNPKWLGDDYVKFFRFAEQIIDKNGEGILAFVSNNGYLNNPTFRGMRASLLRTFDKIYIVDLHGNAKKKETSPNGEKDENIFDIMQGVSLFIGAKTTVNAEWAKVYHTDLWGLREHKFNNLQNGNINFNEVCADEKMAYFISTGSKDKNSYEDGICVAELFPVNVVGVVTGNDQSAIAPTREELNRRIDVVKNSVDEATINELWGRYGSGQTAEKIQNDVFANGDIAPITYRPFDERWTYYSGASCGWIVRPREKNVMGHLMAKNTSPIGANIGLIFARNAPVASDFSMIFVVDKIFDHSILSTQTSTIASVAPLYLKPEGIESQWQPNFEPSLLAKLTEKMTFKPSAIEVFDYIYGVLYDPVYRERFNEFLKRGFPRVPIINAPKDTPEAFHVSEEMFRAYVAAGERLRKLHLMQELSPAELTIDPPTTDNLEIGAVKYKDGVLHINANKRVLGIPTNVWEYRIGGYQVLDKWLKSHKGQTMTIGDFDHIANVTGLLVETIKIQENLRGLHKAEKESESKC
ncbi:MAG: N-6 DNA methylase [Defluviitaleaceae bacterium]|nr:N-6 DNA methylase [Defluviitaleaceae bacterium]